MSQARKKLLKNEKGFTLVELMVALVIIGVLASIAISKYSAMKVRAYDASTEASLNYVFKACKDYWTFNNSADACLLSSITDAGYGYTPAKDIEITIDSSSNNTEYDFVASARHTSSSSAYMINHKGIVSKITLDPVEEEEDGNKGGCSKQAKDDPKSLGKKTKGCKGL